MLQKRLYRFYKLKIKLNSTIGRFKNNKITIDRLSSNLAYYVFQLLYT